MNKNLNKICKKLIHTKLTILYNTTQQNTNIPYNWPAFLAVKNGYTSLCALI